MVFCDLKTAKKSWLTALKGGGEADYTRGCGARRKVTFSKRRSGHAFSKMLLTLGWPVKKRFANT